jgi:hypothetical protein
LNEVWITDKVRFSYDGLSSQRLNTPLYRAQRGESFSKVSWSKLFTITKKFLPYSESSVDFSFGSQTSFETASRVKHFLGDFLENQSFVESFSDLPNNYLFSTPSDRINESDMFLVLGTNLRFDAPSINIKIRKIVRDNSSIKVFSAGSTGASSTTYPVVNLGDLDLFWNAFFKGKHRLSKYFYKAKSPCVIVNLNLRNVPEMVRTLARSSAVFSKVRGERENWYGLNFLSLDASSNLFYDLSLNFLSGGYLPTLYKKPSFTSLYNFGNDNLAFKPNSYSFTTYQGCHGDYGALNANLVIPTLHPYESSATSYLNVYGDFQVISKIRTFGQSALSSSDALSYISERLGTIKTLNPLWFSLRYFTVGSYSFRRALLTLRDTKVTTLDPRSWLLCNPLNSLDSYLYRFGSGVGKFLSWDKNLNLPSLNNFTSIRSPVNPRYPSFYLTNSSTRASHIMALSQSRFKQSTSFYK